VWTSFEGTLQYFRRILSHFTLISALNALCRGQSVLMDGTYWWCAAERTLDHDKRTSWLLSTGSINLASLFGTAKEMR
jgi:hypothetical protein